MQLLGTLLPRFLTHFPPNPEHCGGAPAAAVSLFAITPSMRTNCVNLGRFVDRLRAFFLFYSLPKVSAIFCLVQIK